MIGLPVLLADWTSSQLWFAIPLITSISLVYGATRHEQMVPILHHAWRFAKWIVGFIVIIIAILSIIGWVC
jgi:Na+/alanine symporter